MDYPAYSRIMLNDEDEVDRKKEAYS